MAVTKLTKPPRNYHTWNQTEVTASGQIIGVYESLGNRPASSVTIITSGIDAVVKFNVCQKVYQSHATVSGTDNRRSNAALIGPDAPFYVCPQMIDEVDMADSLDPIYITGGTTQQWNRTELAISDIKFLQIATSMTVIVS